jgi:tRNA-2-methylthio-N6-dimethylallyladenosine synthase
METKVNKIDFDKIDLNKEEPITEPERQYHFIAKARELVKKKSQELGRPLTCKVTTFGCQMNQKDSEKLLGILELVGYEQAETEKADFVIYNTCTVRDNANQKVYGRLGYLNGIKRANPHMLIALCGCMMQEPEAVEKIKKSYSFVDIIFGTQNGNRYLEGYQ